MTTLDVISKGRALLGIGAGWFEPEHEGYGFTFPPIGERLSWLEEALQIARGMFRGERPTLEGRYYQTREALNYPAPIQPGGPFLAARGMDYRALAPAIQEMVSKALVLGDPDTIGEFVQTRIVGQGLDGIVVNLPANGHQPEAVELAANTLAASLG